MKNVFLEIPFCHFQKAHQVTIYIYILILLTIQSGDNKRSLSTNKVSYRAISNIVLGSSGLTNVCL